MLTELLRRLRQGEVPGAPTAGGVPRDAAAALEAELDPVFARLADTERAADESGADGRRRVERVRAEAAERARTLIADARARAPGEQNAAAASRRARADAAIEVVRRDAAAEAARIEDVAAVRVAQLIADLVQRVLANRVTGA